MRVPNIARPGRLRPLPRPDLSLPPLRPTRTVSEHEISMMRIRMKRAARQKAEQGVPK